MALQQWEVAKFESAAIELCNRLHVDPWGKIDPMAVDSPPQWFRYAVRMAEHKLMVETMRNFGHVV